MSSKMAYYDSVTDTIVNCKPGTLAWYHEQRHRLQYKKAKVGYIVDYIGMIVYTVGAILLGAMLITGYYLEGFILLGIIVSPYIFLTALLELDAHFFGSIKYFRSKRNGR